MTVERVWVPEERVNMADVAREAGVSISAVSLVLKGRPGVSQPTRERVLATVERLGYVPRGSNGGNLSAGGAEPLRLFGLLIEKLPLPVLSDLFYAEVILGIQEESQRLGCPVVLQTYGGDVDERDLLREIGRDEIAGLLVAAGGDISDLLIEQLAATGLPVVLVETLVRGDQFNCVLADNFGAGYMATDHLLKLGHRRIAALRGPAKYSSLVDRLRGYFAALGEAGIVPPPELLPLPKSGTPKKGYLQMKQLLALPEPPTAVFAVSDKAALGAMEAIREAGLRIPDDVAIVSIDNVAGSAHTDPPLTTVHVPKREIGQLAARRLHYLIERGDSVPTKTLVYSHLIVRDTCGARQP